MDAPSRSRRVLAALALAAALAACTDSDGDDQVVADPDATTTSSTATTAPTSSSTTATTAATTTSTTGAATTTTVPFDGGVEEVRLPVPASTTEVVAHTGLVTSGGAGTERITFAFDGAVPGVVAGYLERPVRASGSGDEVEVAGAAVLGLRFEPASSARFDGEEVVRTYQGPDRLDGPGATVLELVRTGDFEAVYEWALGVDRQVPFRVEVDEAASTVTVVVPAG